jgi:hypothetical protein
MKLGLEHIEDYTQDLSWMLKALVQLEKEFVLEQWTFKIPVNPETAFQQIVEALHPKLDELIRLRGASFTKQLLYKIDLSESQVAKANSLAQDVEFSEVLAKLILKRCLQKVLIRNYYKDYEKGILDEGLGR